MHNVNTTRDNVWHRSSPVLVFTSAVAFLTDNRRLRKYSFPVTGASVYVSTWTRSIRVRHFPYKGAFTTSLTLARWTTASLLRASVAPAAL